MELIAGIGALLVVGVLLWWLLRQADDPDLDEEEAAGLITGNWPRIEDHLDDD